MSLDVYLREVQITEVFEANITHNLARMAEEAGLYKALWRPEENDFATASQLIPILEAGIAKLKANPERFKKYNPANNWGTYEQFVPWVERYLQACKEHPEAVVHVSR